MDSNNNKIDLDLIFSNPNAGKQDATNKKTKGKII